MNNMRRVMCLACLILIIGLTACDSSYTPKPWGFFRIDMPEREYQHFDTVFPYRFSYPVYARPVVVSDSLSEPYWLNIVFPRFKGTVYLSYKTLHHDLSGYTEDTRKLVLKHIPKANGIEEVIINRPADKMYGILYDIHGSEAASPLQFYVTDSVQHFIRGAVYFYSVPNNDSLQPVIEWMKKDVEVLIQSLRWK